MPAYSSAFSRYSDAMPQYWSSKIQNAWTSQSLKLTGQLLGFLYWETFLKKCWRQDNHIQLCKMVGSLQTNTAFVNFTALWTPYLTGWKKIIRCAKNKYHYCSSSRYRRSIPQRHTRSALQRATKTYLPIKLFWIITISLDGRTLYTTDEQTKSEIYHMT